MESPDVYLQIGLAEAINIHTIIKRRRKRRRNRVIWVRQWISNRDTFGAYNNLMTQLRNCDSSSFTNFVRMDMATFDELLQLVTPLIQRQEAQDTHFRQAIPVGERLAVTLRFLASGTFACT